MTPGLQTDDVPCILVVEDDPALRRIMQQVLEDEGFTVESAPDGREAVRLARLTRPTLIVLDLFLPGLNGSGVAEVLQDEQPDPPPIVVVSADTGARQRVKQMGAFDFLAKPVDLDELVSVVHRGLARRPSIGKDTSLQHPR